MNATAVPWPETTRRIMPSATVHSQMAIPAGRSASGRRQARDAAQPAASPHRNGQDGRRDPGEGLALGVAGAPDDHEDEHAADIEQHRDPATLANRMPLTLSARGTPPPERPGGLGEPGMRAISARHVCALRGRAWAFVYLIFS